MKRWIWAVLAQGMLFLAPARGDVVLTAANSPSSFTAAAHTGASMSVILAPGTVMASTHLLSDPPGGLLSVGIIPPALIWYDDHASGVVPPVPTDLTHLLLLAPRPNPMRSEVVLEFGVPGPSGSSRPVHAQVIDVGGRVVCPLVDGPMAPGWHGLVWDGRGGDGRPAPQGMYLIQLRSGTETAARRVLLLR